MSSPSESGGNTKPVVKDKNPHNYRKVGYSMIVVSVSLVLIALLVWSIGENYHFASDIMASQEMDAMTPKEGFNIIYFDDSQPVGSKLKFLDHAYTFDQAHNLQGNYSKQYEAEKGHVLIFNATVDDNKKQVANLRAAATTTSTQPATVTNITATQANQATKTITLNETVAIAASNPAK